MGPLAIGALGGVTKLQAILFFHSPRSGRCKPAPLLSRLSLSHRIRHFRPIEGKARALPRRINHITFTRSGLCGCTLTGETHQSPIHGRKARGGTKTVLVTKLGVEPFQHFSLTNLSLRVTITEPIFIGRHSQAVRQRSAKPLFPGPIPGGASKK